MTEAPIRITIAVVTKAKKIPPTINDDTEHLPRPFAFVDPRVVEFLHWSPAIRDRALAALFLGQAGKLLRIVWYSLFAYFLDMHYEL